MKIMNSLFLIAAFQLGGCAAHNLMRGSVAMKTSESEAHVCLGDREVKVGDKVKVFNNFCPAKGGRAEYRSGVCEKQLLGYGMITELLNEHYSVVKFDEGVKFTEGTLVEKQ